MGSVGLDAEGRVLVPGLHLLSGNPLQISRQNFSGCDFKHSPAYRQAVSFTRRYSKMK